jgi:hypothetical protein
MSDRIGRRLTGLSLVTLLVAACAPPGGPGVARADRGPPEPGQEGRGPAEAASGPRLGAMRSRDEARQWLVDQSARQLSDARRQLHLTPAQAPAWDAYAVSVGALARDVARFEPDPFNATSLQRIDRRVDRARNLYTALEGVSEAMRALYATLNDEQRVVADRVLIGVLPSLYEGNPFGAAGAVAETPTMSPAAPAPRRTGRSEPPTR